MKTETKYNILVVVIILTIIGIAVAIFAATAGSKEYFSQLISPKQHCKINCERCPRDYSCKELEITPLSINPENLTTSCYCSRFSSY